VRVSSCGGINVAWAQDELTKCFLELTTLHYPKPVPDVTNVSGHMYTQGPEGPILEQAQVVEQTLNRVLPRWRIEVPSYRNESVNRWVQHREAVQRALAVLRLRRPQYPQARSSARLPPSVSHECRSRRRPKSCMRPIQAVASRLGLTPPGEGLVHLS
jgi:hypothetical protein